MLPLRPLMMTLAGAVCTGQALWTLLHPERIAQINRQGWLYERFGAAGVGTGLLLLGLAMLIGGALWSRRAWRRWRAA